MPALYKACRNIVHPPRKSNAYAVAAKTDVVLNIGFKKWWSCFGWTNRICRAWKWCDEVEVMVVEKARPAKVTLNLSWPPGTHYPCMERIVEVINRWRDHRSGNQQNKRRIDRGCLNGNLPAVGSQIDEASYRLRLPCGKQWARKVVKINAKPLRNAVVFKALIESDIEAACRDHAE